MCVEGEGHFRSICLAARCEWAHMVGKRGEARGFYYAVKGARIVAQEESGNSKESKQTTGLACNSGKNQINARDEKICHRDKPDTQTLYHVRELNVTISSLNPRCSASA